MNDETFTATRGSAGDARLIDTHAHLTFPDFEKDRDEVIARARDAGVEYILTIGSGQGMEGNRQAIELAGADEHIFATVGIHPHDAASCTGEWLSEFIQFIQHEKVVAIGEAGLDYYHKHSTPEAQEHCFRGQLKLAHQYHKPIIVHDREAHDDVWRIIQEEGVPERGGVFHCFSGDLAFAEKLVDAGFYLSFNGIVTFPNAHALQGVASLIPLERILLETDCPFLAPQQHRGKRNEPAYLPDVASVIAGVKDLDPTDVGRVTTLNAKRLFGLPGADVEPRIAYRIRNALYLNITNRCNLACTFCPKYGKFEVKGHCLKLTREPDIEQIFQAMGHPQGYDEVVFCGFGEPTKRLELVKAVAKRMKDEGVKRVRLNTDGLANLVYGRDITEELASVIDAVSVSLNAQDAATYARLCPSPYGEKAYGAVKEFIRAAKKHIPEVVATAIDLPDVDLEACRRVADELGVKFRARDYVHLG